MKKAAILFSILMISILFSISSCKKNNDNNDPDFPEKNKYAWVSGEVDSTGSGMILFTPDAGETWVRQGRGVAFPGNFSSTLVTLSIVPDSSLFSEL